MRIVGSIAVLVFVALPVASCSGSSSPESRVGTSGAGVEGFALEGSPVVVVHDPAAAPPGDVPVVGAEVRAVDVEGEVVGTTQTAADGSFALDGLPGGYLRVEVRKDPATADPDAAAEVTGVPGVVVPNPPHAVAREEAVAAALDGVPETARVVGSLQPVPAGTSVQPHGPDPRSADPVPSFGRVLPADEYVFLVDLEPDAAFAHPVVYVFVDAATGDVTRVEELFWPPAFNGVGLWQLDRALYHIAGGAWDELDPGDLPAELTLTPSAEVAQDVPPPVEALRPAPAALPRLQNHNVDPASIFAIVWQASPELYKAHDAKRMVDLLANAGVPFETNIRLVRSHEEGRTALEDSGYKAALLEFNEIIATRLEAGLHSTLVVYITSHAGGPAFSRYFDERRTSSGSVFPPNLMLTSTKACRVRVFLEFCYARHFADDLAAEFDALPQPERHDYVIYSASDRDELSFGLPLVLHLATFRTATPGGRFTTNLLEFAQVQGGDVTGLLNPAGTDIREELDSLFGTINPFQNKFQTPSAIVRPNIPGFCVGDDVGTPLDLMRTLADDARTAGEEAFTFFEDVLGERFETVVQGAAELGEALEGFFRPDEVGEETDHSAPSVGAAIAALAHTELIGSFVFRAVFTAQQIADAFGNTDFPEGAGEHGFTVVANTPLDPQAGDHLVAIARFGGDVPLADPGRFYQYGFVFDADGNPNNNFEPVQGFENDFFGGTDRWYSLEYAPGDGWTLTVSDARDNQVTEVASAARAIIRDDTILLLVPLSEFGDKTPAYRLTAFCHGGDFGLEPPHDWSGDLQDPVDEPLREVR